MSANKLSMSMPQISECIVDHKKKMPKEQLSTGIHILLIRCFRLFSCSPISFGKSWPNCSLKYLSKLATSSSQKVFGMEKSSSQSTGSSKPSVLIVPCFGIKPIGLDCATSAPSHRFKTHSKTREFSPNPGHKNWP